MQDAGCAGDRRINFSRRFARQFQRKRHVFADSHMRIKRVGLEHHGDAALCGRHVIDTHPVDLKITACDLFEPGNHPQQGGFATA